MEKCLIPLNVEVFYKGVVYLFTGIETKDGFRLFFLKETGKSESVFLPKEFYKTETKEGITYLDIDLNWVKLHPILRMASVMAHMGYVEPLC